MSEEDIDAQHSNLLRCPENHLMKVIDSRKQVIGETVTVYRRRRCPTCGYKHSTAEIPLGLAREVLSDE